MVLREIKVAPLSKEDKILFRKVEKAKLESEEAVNKAGSLHLLLWERLRTEHGLPLGVHHYIRGNNIYRYVLD